MKRLVDYPEVMEPKHVKQFLGISETKTYELLNQQPPPFRFVRVGRYIKISKEAFRKWFEGA
ncbi:helix-turn-helix domain-containing protein [Bacillus sp. FSL W7-1360]